MQIYFAHSSDNAERDDWHPLSDHLAATGAKAGEFLSTVGLRPFGQAAGLLHDIGKYAPEFQERLAGSPRRFKHSTAGAQIAVERYDRLGKLLAFCVAGHHAGLANGTQGERISSLETRLAERVSPPDEQWRREVSLPEALEFPKFALRKGQLGFSASLLTRMAFSALVDADFLDTEAYYASLRGDAVPRGKHPSLNELSRRLEKRLVTMEQRAEGTPVNRLRARVLDYVRQQYAERPGVFTLTVPTGGGKTLTSLSFALRHALRHGLQRVIYVIPYMSIIEQTAAVFRDALGCGVDESFVVEHHSSFDEERLNSREAQDKLRLAMENWDAPIIVTTAVQFFESLFANRPSRCRKLHHIANSVVVLDEAQTLPLPFLRPCVAVLDELARNWRTSVVLSTATQPALRADDSGGFPGGFQVPLELAPEPRRLCADPALKRTRIQQRGVLSDAKLAERLRRASQVLCIVNARRHARDLYERLADAPGACHLSTLMCAAHRRDRLSAMRKDLDAGKPVRLVATSLVEAGVDIDFPEVWRAHAGLESIIQAAGRCNREGKGDVGDVFVFEPDEEGGRRTPPEIAQLADATRTVLRHHKDASSLEALDEYFREVYWTRGDAALDAKGILRMLEERARSLDFPFEDIAREFRLIDSPMVPVIVCYRGPDGDSVIADRLVSELRQAQNPGRVARRLQPFVVQIPPPARTALLESGAAEAIQEQRFERQFVVLNSHELYTLDVGLTWNDPTFRDAESLIV